MKKITSKITIKFSIKNTTIINHKTTATRSLLHVCQCFVSDFKYCPSFFEVGYGVKNDLTLFCSMHYHSWLWYYLEQKYSNTIRLNLSIQSIIHDMIKRYVQNLNFIEMFYRLIDSQSCTFQTQLVIRAI